jgi:hypothetical protein
VIRRPTVIPHTISQHDLQAETRWDADQIRAPLPHTGQFLDYGCECVESGGIPNCNELSALSGTLAFPSEYQLLAVLLPCHKSAQFGTSMLVLAIFHVLLSIPPYQRLERLNQG